MCAYCFINKIRISYWTCINPSGSGPLVQQKTGTPHKASISQAGNLMAKVSNDPHSKHVGEFIGVPLCARREGTTFSLVSHHGLDELSEERLRF